MPTPGSCRICSHPGAVTVNKRIAAGNKKFDAATRALMATMELKVDRQTYYKHIEHVTSPIVTAVEKARANPVVKPASNTEFLEMIRDLAASKIANDPTIVTVEHGLKAADSLERRKKQGGNLTVVLAKLATAGAFPALSGVMSEDPIEVDYEEIPTNG